MLEPVHKQDPGTPGERLLARMAEDAFFSLWSYPSVHRRSGSGKHLVVKEVADLLVFFENELILVSEKDKHFSSTATNDVAWQRWARESVAESASQLLAAENHIKGRSGALFLDNRAQHPFPFEIDRTTVRVHLVALCRNVKVAKRARCPALVSSSGDGLLFQADVASGRRDLPFVVGDLDPARRFVHVLDEDAFELLVREPGTIADFLKYLDERERAVRDHGLARFSNEGELLASYLANVDGLGRGAIRVVPESPGSSSFVVAGLPWSAFIESEAYLARWRFYQDAARPWGDIAARFSEAIMQANVGEEAVDQALRTHEAALRLWASENLYARARLALLLFEKYRQVPSNARSARLAPSPCRPERLYVFLFFPWLDTYPDYAYYRRALRMHDHV